MRQWQGLGMLLQLGWLLAFSVLLPLFLGIILDRTFHSFPLFLLLGVALGGISGTVGAVRIATRAIENVDRMRGDETGGSTRKEDKA